MALSVVFDLDGTLIDSAPDIHVIANHVLDQIGADPISLTQTRSFVGAGAAVFVERMRTARAIPEADQDKLLRAFLDMYEGAVTLTRTYPDVPEVLQGLRRAGARLGICTNKPMRPTASVLRHLGLLELFESVTGGDSLQVKKPDPAPLLATFADLGEGVQIYVGDSEVDAETAVRAKVPFLLFTEGYRRADLSQIPFDGSFAAFSDLPALIHRHAGKAPTPISRRTARA